jgi:hypothetical protein
VEAKDPVSIEHKLSQAIGNLVRHDNMGRKNAQQRRRACYWIRRVDQLERVKDREFQRELWESLFKALADGRIQSLHVNYGA